MVRYLYVYLLSQYDMENSMAQTKKMTLAFPLDIFEIIEANSTSTRTKAAFVSECIRQAITPNPTGILERIAEQMEKRYQEVENK